MTPAVWPAALGLLGAVAGSFLATLVVRWPKARSVARGRSACDGCGAPLRAWELVPLVSWLALRGRCARCGVRIDARHPLVEAVCGGVGVLAGLAAPGAAGVAGAVFGWLLVALAALDAAELWLPDRLTAPLALAGLAAGAGGIAPTMPDRLIGGAAGYSGLWLVGVLYRRFRGREGLGGGDPKLLGAIGLWLGWRMLPPVLVLAGLAGLGAIVALRLRGRVVDARTRLPFGALLAAAAFPAWLALAGAG